MLESDSPWPLPQSDESPEHRAAQARRTAEPEVGRAGRERRRPHQPFGRQLAIAPRRHQVEAEVRVARCGISQNLQPDRILRSANAVDEMDVVRMALLQNSAPEGFMSRLR